MTDQERQEIFAIEVRSMADLWKRHEKWSIAQFGERHSLLSLIHHIREKLDVLQAKPSDTDAALDVMTLAADIALRGGATPYDVAQGLLNIQNRNILRDYPDAGSLPAGTPYHHIPTQGERIDAGELTKEQAIEETERDRKS